MIIIFIIGLLVILFIASGRTGSDSIDTVNANGAPGVFVNNGIIDNSILDNDLIPVPEPKKIVTSVFKKSEPYRTTAPSSYFQQPETVAKINPVDDEILGVDSLTGSQFLKSVN